jgi:hypothetical protein
MISDLIGPPPAGFRMVAGRIGDALTSAFAAGPIYRLSVGVFLGVPEPVGLIGPRGCNGCIRQELAAGVKCQGTNIMIGGLPGHGD